MPTSKRRKAVPHHRRPPLKNKNYQYTSILREITGTILAALIFAASMWSSVFGMTGAFDDQKAIVVSEVDQYGR